MRESKYRDNDVQKGVIEYLCILNFVMAMFRLTAQDIKYGDKDTKKEARKFLKSVWFNELCENVNLGPARVKYAILHSDKISSRSSYE